MFPKHSSINRPLPFLLGGFHGADFPPFNRYYEEAKTAFVLLLAFGFPRPGYPCGVVGVSWRSRINNQLRLPGCLGRPALPWCRCFVTAGRREALPSSRECILYICPALRPRPDLPVRPIRPADVVPTHMTVKTPAFFYCFRGSITRLLYSLSTLCATISDDYTRLASGGWSDLAAQDWVPACILRKVSKNSANPPFTGLAWRYIWTHRIFMTILIIRLCDSA